MSFNPLNRGKHERTAGVEESGDDRGYHTENTAATEYPGDQRGTADPYVGRPSDGQPSATPSHSGTVGSTAESGYAGRDPRIPAQGIEEHHTGANPTAERGSHEVAERDDGTPSYTEGATTTHVVSGDDEARERFGGINWGSAFFGWLVAIAVTVLSSSVVAAIASAVGSATDFSQTQAQRDAGAVGLGAAIALVVVLLLGYFAGGYVAGRMSRYDGAKQGVAVWVIGLVVTILAVIIGVAFGAQYNVLDRVELPRIPVPTDTATLGGIITGLAVLVGTLLAAMLGGTVGHRYHDKVDRAAYR